jgi:hypothetical protein
MPYPSTQGVHTFPRRAFPSWYWPLWMWPAAGEGYRGPAVPVHNWAAGQQPIQFTPGAGEAVGMLAFVPVEEPVSVGPPPVLPRFVRRVTVAWDVRSVGVRAGCRVTGPNQTVQNKARYMVGWPGLTHTEREQLRAFFRDEVIASENGGGRFGFDLEPDGEGKGMVIVRPVGGVPLTLLSGGGTAGGVHGIDEIECEELFAVGSGVGGGLGSGGDGGGGGIDVGDDGSDWPGGVPPVID